ncbi:hypothetical protein MG290_07545 [Flavobacterium sp. CBA20B-1]|uniref:hypothetical protein n=1 Tax=unclassified Flavobacterium TaxID=196869 RepID=UPI0022250932|nr:MULTISPECIES: hypothetical protein [unclassified Flavobacterium]WCM40832.1 hypothetical protein MG290_07545 [Flavobacterium sp. CBA20B-1]
MTIGNFININLPGEVDNSISFEQFVLTTPLYMHEYGHIFQSERSGFGYLFAYGIPSLISAAKDEKRGHVHNDFGTETSANRWARRYFDKHYKGLVDWSQYQNPETRPYYPLN